MSLLNRSNADFSLKNQHIVKLMFCVVFAVLFFSCVTGFASAYPVTITFEANGGTVSPSTITVEAGEYFTLPTPVYEGRTFTSWYGGIKMDMWHDAGERVCVYTDFTFVASWVPQYTITFNPDGGLVNPSSITVESGTYITLPEPTRDGYSFISWYGFANDAMWHEAGSEFKVTQDKILVAYWDEYDTVTFVSAVSDIQNVKVSGPTGEYITIPTMERPGYSLTSWVSSGTHYYPGDSYKISGDASFQAVWVKNKYTVYYDANGGNPVESKQVYIGDSLTLPKTSYFGHTFAGWYHDNIYVGMVGDVYVPTDSVTLTAKWNQINFGYYLLCASGILIIIILLVTLMIVLRRR